MPLSDPTLPVSLVLSGRRCLLVSGGPATLSRGRALLESGAALTVVGAASTAELAELAGRGAAIAHRPYREGEAAGYFLVVCASTDRTLCARVLQDADAAGAFVNAVDDLEHSSVHFPAVARFGPVAVAVSSGAASPALARYVRDAVAAALGEEIAFLADILAPVRARLRESGHSSEGRDWFGLIEALRARRAEAGAEAGAGDEAARALAREWLRAETGGDRSKARPRRPPPTS